MIPNFIPNPVGFDVLPPGIHPATVDEFTQRFGYNRRRIELIEGLLKGVKMLHEFGSEIVYVDGSFVKSKELPGDFDACWTYQEDPEIILEDLVEKYPVFEDLLYPRSLQKSTFGGEFIPAFFTEGSSGKTFLDFFQVDKASGMPKGIIQLI